MTLKLRVKERGQPKMKVLKKWKYKQNIYTPQKSHTYF